MSEDFHPPTKSDLLMVIRTERARFEALIETVPESRQSETGVEAHWSIKDIMAHIAAWERLAMDRIHAGITGEPLKFPLIAGNEFVDQFNGEIYEANKARPLAEVYAEFHAVHRQFLDQIEALDAVLLPQSLPFDWAGKLTYQVVISANTHWHYAEHADSIEKWLENQEE